SSMAAGARRRVREECSAHCLRCGSRSCPACALPFPERRAPPSSSARPVCRTPNRGNDMPQEKVTSLKRGNDEMQFDGERFVPGAAVEISYHHWLRYFFALQFAQDKRVLDVASGEGYGAAYLASRAATVDGFDASAEAVRHAAKVYSDNPRLSFANADIESFFRDAQPGSYDLVTAFEVIEHVDEPAQRMLLEGIRKVLAPGGVALIS